MQVKIFDISSRGGEESIEQMNKFIRGHKVLDIDRQFYVSSDNAGHWSVFVTYLSQSGTSPKKRLFFPLRESKRSFIPRKRHLSPKNNAFFPTRVTVPPECVPDYVGS